MLNREGSRHRLEGGWRPRGACGSMPPASSSCTAMYRAVHPPPWSGLPNGRQPGLNPGAPAKVGVRFFTAPPELKEPATWQYKAWLYLVPGVCAAIDAGALGDWYPKKLSTRSIDDQTEGAAEWPATRFETVGNPRGSGFDPSTFRQDDFVSRGAQANRRIAAGC